MLIKDSNNIPENATKSECSRMLTKDSNNIPENATKSETAIAFKHSRKTIELSESLNVW
jgi:hypothetical protein